MAKYSFEVKMKVVQDYLNKKGGYRFLGNQYNLHQSIVQKWVNAYLQFGPDGLLRSRKNKVYSVQEKLNAIELYLTNEMSTREVANSTGLNNPALISAWLTKYRTNGIDGLSNAKGRPSKMPEEKKKSINKTKNGNLDKENQTTEDRIKELEQENYMQRLEIAYLKELRSLQKRKSQQKRINENRL